MKAISLYSILMVVIITTITAVSSEDETVFNWPGPLRVPVNERFIEQGRVRIQLSDNETVRELRIRERVVVTLDCTPKLNMISDLLKSMNLSNNSIETVNWFAQFYDSQGLLTGSERPIFSDTVISSIRYNITGEKNEILGIDGSEIPTLAKQGGSGVYRCEVCYNITEFGLCNSTSVINNVIGDPPVLIVGDGTTTTTPGRFSLEIGTNFCITRATPLPPVIAISCSHNDSLISIRPEPAASYLRNGQPIDPSSDYLFIEFNPRLVGFSNTLQIEPIGLADFDRVLGNYTCTLSNIFGASTATTIITECCFEADEPNIIAGSGFLADVPENTLVIGVSTCFASNLTLECALNTSITNTSIEWKINGELTNELDGTTKIAVPRSGEYTCCTSNRCGTKSATSSVLGSPVINSSTGINRENSITVGQTGCVNSDSSSISIMCPVTFGNEFTQITWASLANPSQVIGNGPTLSVNASGSYRCTASNSCGTATSQAIIQEFIEIELSGLVNGSGGCDKLKTSPVGVDLCPFVGDDVKLVCTSSDGMAPPLINGISDMLTLSSVTHASTGPYTCIASNVCGASNSSLNIQVFEPATIDRTSTLPPSTPTRLVIGVNRTVVPPIMSGVRVELHCPYSGVETPQAQWFKVMDSLPTPIVPGGGYMLVPSSNNLILVIDSFSSSFNGTYRCVVSNNAGDDQGDTVLESQPDAGEMPIWHVTPWTNCSKSCGGGMRSRSVTCVLPSTGDVVSDIECAELKPNAVEYCNTDPCCERDLYPAYCKLIPGTNRCENDNFQRACCCTCGYYD
jgi:hypothetical protein